MPLVEKPALFKLFEDALRKSGLYFLRLSGEGEHPAVYHIIKGGESYQVRVYIWNLTFGGRVTLQDEWRIQVTGLPLIDGRKYFVHGIRDKTVILGWCESLRVFAAYDVRKHLGVLGSSPSIQIRQPALEKAQINGIAPHFKGEEEVAFAVKPAYMGTYLDNMEDIHACGSSEATLGILKKICQDPESVNDQDIREKVPESRRYAVVSTRKALREVNFRNRVLTAYSNACAMCGIQLNLLDAAHILPAAHPDSTDETSNGIALCTLHHRAYDCGMVTFDAAYQIHRNITMEKELIEGKWDGGLMEFQAQLFAMIEVPPARVDRPSPIFVRQVNELRGWTV